MGNNKDCWQKRDQAIETFTKWLEATDGELPIHPNEVRAFSAYLVENEFGTSTTPIRSNTQAQNETFCVR